MMFNPALLFYFVFPTIWRCISLDEGFTSHQTVARTAGNVLLRLGDSVLLPFKCSDYTETLEQYLNVAVENFEVELKAHDISMGTGLKSHDCISK